MSGPRRYDLVKLYYRIGEVSQIVGVQPHVLRYWESEFRTIRPQKSSKGQRVYSRRDVEKLLRVKDLLRNQGFTIAGARKQLSSREPEPLVSSRAPPAVALLAVSEPASVAEVVPEPAVESRATAVEARATTVEARAAVAAESPVPGGETDASREVQRLRSALVQLRGEIVGWLQEWPEDRPDSA